MKFLLASTPATGHLNPILSIGRILIAAGHEVAVLTGDIFRRQVEEAGARFCSLPPGANFDLRRIETVIPDIARIPQGPERRLAMSRKIFIDVVPLQSAGLGDVLADFPADAILVDNTFFGIFPMLLGPRSARPPIAVCGTMFLHAPRDDGAPTFLGLPPAVNKAELDAYATMATEQDKQIVRPVLDRLNELLKEMGCPPLQSNVHDAAVLLPDLFLQMTVASFEFPRKNLPPSVVFAGALPIMPGQAPLPDWAHELDGSRKVVLVTQGTVSNLNFDQLVIPTLKALAERPDILVVVTAGGRAAEALPAPLPANARTADYLPFDWLLPKVDVFVTNGGYGSVNQALSHGIPIVGAGVTEDKGDVNARVAWSGAGINLATSEPTEKMIKDAVLAILGVPIYRQRAEALAAEFFATDTPALILEKLEGLASAAQEWPRRSRTAVV
ncbi:UDP:flavonoid glycosyltransferase YjiC, YdhE family [Rhizobium sp. NFR07]|uniref:glycosyltransferase n=1 Tax=Rhizobium sp. NFR07 TaxID=1566262 RepID=UPI0008F224D6|nr:nucleotide disphospho-sugar-binding domain-containing protein [Rhizobium sp. NFR07]SFB11000.1 UDP:flavonoid glycosyltransferase YjiC, YdhE family [Rhizobium sp. NFR07]